MKPLFAIAILICISVKMWGQVETDNPTSEFIYKGRQYVPGRPWVTIGWGYGHNFSESVIEPNFYVDGLYSFKNKMAIGLGYLTSRYQFLDKDGPNLFLPHSMVKHSTNNIHTLFGYRFEQMWNNLSFSGGPSLNWGYNYNYSDSLGNDYHSAYSEFGFYASIQYSRKLYYDLGLGISLWGSYSNSYKVVGLSLNIFLSGSFKRHI